MVKTYLSLKQCIVALIFLLTTAIVIYSCKKDSSSIEEIKSELITDAKVFFKKDILSTKRVILNDQNYRHGLTKKLLWDKAYVKKISLGDAVIVPIKFDDDFEITNGNSNDHKKVTSYLIIYTDIKDIKHAEWVTLIPNGAVQQTNGKFIGTATVEDWNGNYIKSFAYGADREIISVKLAESDSYKQISLRRLNCYTIHYYGHNYVEGVGGTDYWYETGSETYCQSESDVDYGPNGGDYGDMGSGGGGTNGNSNSNETNKDIHNKTTDSCISKTVEEALKANKDIIGVMADIIKKFDASKTVSINIYDGYIYYKDQYGNNDITRPKPGQTTNQQFMGNSFSADITLGIDYHDGTSKENLISSMIHEIIHAYLGYTSNNFLKTETDHNVIAEKYITPMAHYLNSSFGIQMSDAYALAWSGVSDSKVFNAATPNDTEFTVVYGGGIPNGKITVGDINRIAGAYKLSTKIPANNGYTKGSKICD